MSKNQVLLTPMDVAKILKLNLLTIYKYIRVGELSAFKFGRTYRVNDKDLEIFMEKNKVLKKQTT
jgi:putative molybdopterin biosynthesis protein